MAGNPTTFKQKPRIKNGNTSQTDLKLADYMPVQHEDINSGVMTINHISVAQSLCQPVATTPNSTPSGGAYTATCSNYPDFSLTYPDKDGNSHYLIGMKVRVIFTTGITYGSVSGGTYPTLNINGSGAIPLLAQGKTMASGACSAGQSLEFTLIPYGNGVAWDADSNVRESTSDYTIYTDGSIAYSANYINANKLNSKKIQLHIGASYNFTVDGYYLSFQCYGIAIGQDRMGGIVIGEGGNYTWYNTINSALLPTVSGVYSSGKTTITLTNNTSHEQSLDINYIA
jgi:hypothetical protein